ncbi:hypothetical protein N9Y17_02140 [Gammaproteobacteria bacterium]|nr:hypothetical protein [Gammaproteobacteria bacterium]
MIYEKIVQITFNHISYSINTSTKEIKKSSDHPKANHDQFDQVIHTYFIMMECLNFIHLINPELTQSNLDQNDQLKKYLMDELDIIGLKKSIFFKNEIDRHIHRRNNFKERIYQLSLNYFFSSISQPSPSLDKETLIYDHKIFKPATNKMVAKIPNILMIKNIISHFKINDNDLQKQINEVRTEIPITKAHTFFFQLLKFILKFFFIFALLWLHYAIFLWLYPCTPIHTVIIKIKVSALTLGLFLSLFIAVIWHGIVTLKQSSNTDNQLFQNRSKKGPMKSDELYQDELYQQVYCYLNHQLEKKHPEHYLKIESKK